MNLYNTFNAENEWTYQSYYGVTYLYDGDGRKVKVSGGSSGAKLYWNDVAGQVLAETDSRGNAVDNYVYFNGVSIAKLHIEPGPTYYSYYVRDHLGTTRMITDQVGNVCYDADYFPWGGEQHIYVNGCPQNYKFSGKERDPDMGSDYFGARFYKYTMARFYSPDWSAAVEPVPYAKLDNPQSLNLYTYVVNNPLRYADADGHDMEGSGGSDSISGTADSGQGAPGGPAQNNDPTLKLGGTKVDVSFSAGTASDGSKGVDIYAKPQNCDSCRWAQTMTRTGDEADGPRTDRAGGIPTSPLYPAASAYLQNFYDTPRINKGDSGTFTAVTTIGIANSDKKTFQVIGSMTYGFGVDKSGNLSASAPRVATPSEQARSISILKRDSPTWTIGP